MKDSSQKFHCKQNHKILYVCNQKQCNQSPFICSEDDCPQFKTHEKCEHASKFSALISKINTKRGIYNPVILKSIQWCDSVLKQFTVLKEHLSGVLQRNDYGLQNHETEFVKLLSTNQQSKITSHQIKLVIQSLNNRPEALLKQAQIQSDNHLRVYGQYIKKVIVANLQQPFKKIKQISQNQYEIEKRLFLSFHSPKIIIEYLQNESPIEILKKCGIKQLKIWKQNIPWNTKYEQQLDVNINKIGQIKIDMISSLSLNYVDRFVVKNVLTKLSSLQRLQILSEEFLAEIDDQCITNLSDKLYYNLRHIKIFNCNITFVSVVPLLKNVTRDRRSCSLHLKNCSISRRKLQQSQSFKECVFRQQQLIIQ